jgi:hypothetical protein
VASDRYKRLGINGSSLGGELIVEVLEAVALLVEVLEAVALLAGVEVLLLGVLLLTILEILGGPSSLPDSDDSGKLS